DLRDELLFVVQDPLSIRYFSACVIRFRHAGGDVFRYRTEQCRIDTVVDERCLELDRASRVAPCRSKGREVAIDHRCGRNEPSDIGTILAIFGALKATEEDALVFHDGAADRAAILIPFQCAALLREIIPGIEKIIADEFEKIAVKIIRSGLGYSAYL